MEKLLGLSSLDIFNLVKEFAVLEKGHMNKFYQCKNRFTLRINAKGSSYNLNIVLPGLIFLSHKTKYAAETASSFAMSVRKHILNATLTSIRQLGTERILELVFQKEHQFRLVVELFSKGNLILVDEQGRILTLYSTQTWSTRTLRRGIEYEPPPPHGNYLCSEKIIGELLKKTKAGSVVKFMAVELGLGGVYAEMVCRLGGFDKNEKQVSAKKIKQAIDKLLKLPVEPHFNGAFSSYGPEGQPFKTISEMVEHYLSGIAPETSSAATRLRAVIKQQESAMVSLVKKIDENTRRGELIYEHYSELKQILDKVSELKPKGWEMVFKYLEAHPRVASINRKSLSFTFRA